MDNQSGHAGTAEASPASPASSAATNGNEVQVLPGLTARRAELERGEMDSIHVTLSRFALGVDAPDAPMLASTLSEDPLLTIRMSGQPVFQSVRGRDAMTNFLVSTRETQGFPAKHFVTNVCAEQGPGATALVHAYLLVTGASDGSTFNTAQEIVNVAMERTSDGIWLITQFDIVIDGAEVMTLD